METLKDFLWPIVAIGGLGAFIDFLIGKAGQERAKDFLLKWWVRFDDVQWRNFGREEGLFAGRLIEKWFGRRIWSPRRIIGAFGLLILILIIGYTGHIIYPDPNDIFCFGCKKPTADGNYQLLIYYTEGEVKLLFNPTLFVLIV